ncbi:hypothetical protein AJ79_06799 [Helicocarpus griseus UAMH5409]|uniref:Cyclin n=1 Tax=Helicocarpus griseus UAMH5409 TaxID=1447875 RepID=A0A2B7X9T7_9EURO|nr:hypothetical protein AJ79_06799 [Helicocarpus griseus UAMH5409]
MLAAAAATAPVSDPHQPVFRHPRSQSNQPPQSQPHPATTSTSTSSSATTTPTTPTLSSSTSTSTSSSSTAATVHSPLSHHPPQNAASPALPSAPNSASAAAAAAPMTSHPNSHRLPDRQRPTSSSSYRQHPPQHAHGFDQAGFPLSSTPSGLSSSSHPQHSPRLQPAHSSSRSLGASEAPSPARIQVRDLAHIRSFANEEVLASSRRLQSQGTGSRFRQDVGRQYEISAMPVQDIIEMVAGLLTKITITNDLQHEHVHRNIPPPNGAAGISAQTTSVLAFHGKNVPNITILSYLSRIHKYCPTTYEVFLSLLVYFDRMTEMVNKGFIQSLQQRSDQHRTGLGPQSSSSPATPSTATPNRPSTRDPIVTPPSSALMRARDKDIPSSPSGHSAICQDSNDPSSGSPPDAQQDDPFNFSHYFVVDSFNIHRLVIAGVTCASKFFSDVFYTNSRYAKVGGLPLLELNHLELQFLLLNDFRLAVPVEELEAYGTMLVEFYAREVVAQQQQEHLQLVQEPQFRGDAEDPLSARDHRAREEYISQTPTPP